MNMLWPYYTLRDGRLFDEADFAVFDHTFASEAEAEQWLVDNDIRGTVR